MPGFGIPTRTARLAAVAIVVGAAAAACSSGSTGSPATGPATSSATATLGPWQGSLVTTTLPPRVQALRAVACPTARRCWAVGSSRATSSSPAGPAIESTSDGGATWSAEPVPPTVGYLSAIACASTRSCTAVGQVGVTGEGPGAVLTTSNGGTTWTLQPVPTGTTDVTAVDCRVGGRCTALGVVTGQVTTIAPSSGMWTAGGSVPAGPAVATALSCTDGTHCWATASQAVDVGHVTGVVAATSDGGATWTLQHVPTGTGALRGIDCVPGPSAAVGASCVAVGTTTTVLSGGRGGLGVVLTSGNGGRTWTSAPVSPTAADLLAVSCTAGPCVAVGTSVDSAPASGVVVLTGVAGLSAQTWRRAVVAPVALPLTGVSCVSLSACVVVGESVAAHLSGA